MQLAAQSFGSLQGGLERVLLWRRFYPLSRSHLAGGLGRLAVRGNARCVQRGRGEALCLPSLSGLKPFLGFADDPAIAVLRNLHPDPAFANPGGSTRTGAFAAAFGAGGGTEVRFLHELTVQRV